MTKYIIFSDHKETLKKLNETQIKRVFTHSYFSIKALRQYQKLLPGTQIKDHNLIYKGTIIIKTLIIQ